MAIKGKSKSRSRRVVAAPPRPQIVARKRQLWEQPLAWVVVGLLVVGAITFGTLRKVHADDVATQKQAAAALKAREAKAVGRFAAAVSANLPSDQQTPSGGSSLIIFASLPTMLDQSIKGEISPSAARTRFLNLAATAQKDAQGMSKVNAITMINGEFDAGTTQSLKTPGLTQSLLNQSQQQMQQALAMYASIGRIAASAAVLPQASRNAILTEAKAMVSEAQSMFGNAYNTLNQIEVTVGAASNTLPLPAPPSPSPSPSASAKAKKSPKPKASASP